MTATADAFDGSAGPAHPISDGSAPIPQGDSLLPRRDGPPTTAGRHGS
jgi:hypothetical protein